jgi:hypothetical protein
LEHTLLSNAAPLVPTNFDLEELTNYVFDRLLPAFAGASKDTSSQLQLVGTISMIVILLKPDVDPETLRETVQDILDYLELKLAPSQTDGVPETVN